MKRMVTKCGRDYQDAESTDDEIKTLRKRVATLESENASSRKQVLTLREKRGS